uniref:Uncharacterized protein n=1 Tax=Setaria digitata TaxID=48799 RepID=A0A915PQW4_9BILA
MPYHSNHIMPLIPLVIAETGMKGSLRNILLPLESFEVASEGMKGILIAVLVITITCYVTYVAGRHSIAYVLVPLSTTTTVRLGLATNESEVSVPCSDCFFKFDRAHDRLIQYYNRPIFGEIPMPCRCFEFLKKGFVDINEPSLIAISGNVISIDTSVYYGVMKTDRCRLDSIKAVHTVNGLQLALLIRCS